MCWGFITGKLCSSPLGIRVNPFLLLFLAALPDIDLVLGIFGIQHRTWTHSMLFWSLAFIPFFIKYKRTSIPYFAAVISHILLGDAIVGRNNPFWPIGNFNFSLGYNLLSIQNIALEAAGLAIFLIWVLKSDDTRISFFGKNRHLWSILPIVPLVGFVMFVYSYEITAGILQEHGIIGQNRLIESVPSIMASPLFSIEAALHVILLAFLTASLVLGFRKQSKEKSLKSEP